MRSNESCKGGMRFVWHQYQRFLAAKMLARMSTSMLLR